MVFEAIYYGDRLRVLNPLGDVGVVTLWSPVKKVESMLAEWGVDLGEGTSRIAAIGNLYGNGLPHLLRNLLWNPQVAYVLVMGQNLSGSAEHLKNFFERGLEDAEVLGARLHRIVGTNRYIDGLVTPEDFVARPVIRDLGKLTDDGTRSGLVSFFEKLPPLSVQEPPRILRELPHVEVTRYPSEPRSHTIVRSRALDAWRELVYRLVRFGHRNMLKKGGRIELQNVKVVIQEPIEDRDDVISELGFDPSQFREYQKRILSSDPPEETSYTYGNRLRGYFKRKRKVVDFVKDSIKQLRQDKQTRHAYFALWDSARDSEGSSPCLVSLFLRMFEGRLTLTATFRTHNAMSAWPENVWGLMAIQREICVGAQVSPGPITVISHSISVDADPAILARAQQVAEQRVSDDDTNPETGKRELRFDPNGEFTITVDTVAREIVAQHTYQGLVLNEYRGKTAVDIECRLARDCAISLISHALYVGRELAKAEYLLKTSRRKEGF
jgi:thymidylate synthase